MKVPVAPFKRDQEMIQERQDTGCRGNNDEGENYEDQNSHDSLYQLGPHTPPCCNLARGMP